jgi:hypothetical protein
MRKNKRAMTSASRLAGWLAEARAFQVVKLL